MKILQIIESLDIGGAENFTVQLCNQLSKNNDVILLNTKASNAEHNYQKHLNSNIKLITFNWEKKYSLFQLIEITKTINRIKPDIIHVHLHNSFYYVFAYSIFYKRIPIIHTMHNSVDVWRSILKIINKWRFLSKSIIHVCISSSIYSQMKKEYPKLRSAFINNGIDRVGNPDSSIRALSLFKKLGINSEQNMVFIAIGNITRFKNFSLLAEALKQLEKTNIKCILIGGYSDSNEVEKIRSINATNLFLAGSMDKAGELLVHADALVVSSTHEGMPIVALEAMSLGKPILTTPAGGMIDLVKDNYNGFISENHSLEKFSDILIKFMNLNLEEKKKLGENSMNSFNENYNISKISLQYQELYLN